MKFVTGFFIFIFLSFAHANNDLKKQLDNLVEIINAGSEQGDIIKDCERLFKAAEKLPSPWNQYYQLKALVFKVENYRNKNLYNQFTLANKEFYLYLESCKDKQRNQAGVTDKDLPITNAVNNRIYLNFPSNINEDSLNLPFEFAYYYFQSLIDKSNGDFQSAFGYLEKCRKYIRKYIKYYKPGEYNQRMAQVYGSEGSIFTEDRNFEKAKNYLLQSLNYAQIADEKFNTANRDSWDYTGSAIVRLIRLGVASNDLSLFNQFISKIKRNKSSHFKFDRERNLYLAILSNDSLKIDLAQVILKNLKNNPIADTDPEINLKISEYLLLHGQVMQSKEYLQKAKEALKDKPDLFAPNVNFHVLQARISLFECEFGPMVSSIDSAYKIMDFYDDASKTWIDPGTRSNALDNCEQILELYLEAYDSTHNQFYIREAVSVAGKAINGIKEHQKYIFSDTDRIILLTQLRKLTTLGLKSHYLALTKGIEISVSQAILDYFELNKSFNLRFNRGFEGKKRPDNRNNPNSLLPLEALNKEPDDSMNIYNPDADKSASFSIREIQRHLMQNQTIVEYYNTSNELYSLIINKNSIKFYRHFEKRDSVQFQKLILGFKTNINSMDLDLSVDLRKNEFVHYSSDLYRILIQPIASMLKHKVIIVPDADISGIAFGALLTHDTLTQDCTKWPFWVKEHFVSPQHSIAIWVDELNHVREIKKPIELTAFAPQFNNLTYNIEEAAKVASLVKPSYLMDSSDASGENFEKHEQDTRIIHFSSHAYSDPSNENKSYILMQKDTLNSKNIEIKKIPADLVVLSACETGTGKIVPAEGVMSLARSFFMAGSHSVISTLWKIDDKTSRDNMIEIYNNMLLGKSKDEAIHDMQISYLSKVNNPEKAFPYYWAAYQCEGDLRP
ncbi:MAG: CHAT domain-containing protein, partial [Saprospiraceae bacterium]